MKPETTVTIYQEDAGLISDKPIYCAINGPYLYTATILPDLFRQMADEWENDQHLVG